MKKLDLAAPEAACVGEGAANLNFDFARLAGGPINDVQNSAVKIRPFA